MPFRTLKHIISILNYFLFSLTNERNEEKNELKIRKHKFQSSVEHTCNFVMFKEKIFYLMLLLTVIYIYTTQLFNAISPILKLLLHLFHWLFLIYSTIEWSLFLFFLFFLLDFFHLTNLLANSICLGFFLGDLSRNHFVFVSGFLFFLYSTVITRFVFPIFFSCCCLPTQISNQIQFRQVLHVL